MPDNPRMMTNEPDAQEPTEQPEPRIPRTSAESGRLDANATPDEVAEAEALQEAHIDKLACLPREIECSDADILFDCIYFSYAVTAERQDCSIRRVNNVCARYRRALADLIEQRKEVLIATAETGMYAGLRELTRAMSVIHIETEPGEKSKRNPVKDMAMLTQSITQLANVVRDLRSSKPRKRGKQWDKLDSKATQFIEAVSGDEETSAA